MSQQPPTPPESSSDDPQWQERVDKALAEANENLRRIRAHQNSQDRDADQFKRTMAAVIESLHQATLRLEKTVNALAENHTLLSGIAAEHHDKLHEHEQRLEDLER